MATSTVTIRVDTHLHKRLKARANTEGRKLQTMIERMLTEALKVPVNGGGK